MPRLPLETYLYPHDLLSAEMPAVEPENSWWVLHTRPRAEKALARRFLDEDVRFFLPLSQKAVKCRGRAQPAYLPLFPGYVFLFGDNGARVRSLRTNQIVGCLQVPDQRRLHQDLQRVHRLIHCNSGLVVEPRLLTGASVEITAGPFAGMTGKILNKRSQLRFGVEVHFLRQSVTVEMESWMLEYVAPGSGGAAGSRNAAR